MGYLLLAGVVHQRDLFLNIKQAAILEYLKAPGKTLLFETLLQSCTMHFSSNS